MASTPYTPMRAFFIRGRNIIFRISSKVFDSSGSRHIPFMDYGWTRLCKIYRYLLSNTLLFYCLLSVLSNIDIWTINLIDFCIFSKNPYPKFLVAQNLIKKGSRELYFFIYLSYMRFWGKFFSTALVQSNILHKKCLLLLT